MNTKLLPCPFCGHIKIYQKAFNEKLNKWLIVECQKCHAETVVSNWNHRVYPPEVRTTLTAAEEYITAEGGLFAYEELKQAVHALNEMEKKE